MESNNSKTIDNWKDLGFADLQQVLDEQSSKIISSQEEGATSRKALSAKTKAFRKLTDEEKLSEIRGLLKGYQSEIDSLTSRSKYAESCFMNVYKSLALLPDPEPLLNSKQDEIDNLRSKLVSVSETGDKDSTLARELERQKLRVSQLEKQLKATTNNGNSEATNDNSNSSRNEAIINNKVNELETKLAETQSNLIKTQNSLKDQMILSQKHQESLHKALTKLAIQQDYDEIKKELVEVKSRELSDLDDDVKEPISTSREAVVHRKLVKKLEAENQTLQKECQRHNSEISRCHTLISKLEDDLAALQPSDTFSTVSGWTAIPRTGSSSTIGGSGGHTSAGGMAVSNIIVQQRDRYKKRAHELEEVKHKTEAALAQTQKDLDTVKRESYVLYDRIRQLQAGTSSSGASAGTLAGATASMSSNKPLYETSAGQQLKDLDLDRRVMGLSPLNAKLVELLARGVVDQKVRTGITAYVAILHVVAVAGLII